MKEIIYNPAFWAAIAAAFSATAAFGNWRQQRQNFLHSIRPELYLHDWKLTDLDSEIASKLMIGRIENFGRGPALDVWGILQELGASKSDNAAHLFKSHFTTILRPSETKPIEAKGIFYWEHGIKVDPNISSNHLITLRFSIYYLDLHGNQYESRLSLTVFRNITVAAGVEVLTPNLYLSGRDTYMKSRRRVKWESRIHRILRRIQKVVRHLWPW